MRTITLALGASLLMLPHLHSQGSCSWSPLPVGSAPPSSVYDLEVYDEGNGAALFGASTGDFVAASGLHVNGVARWDGSAWTPLGAGLPNQSFVNSLAVFDAGAGPLLFVGGWFGQAGGGGPGSAISLASWDGLSWSGAGLGVLTAQGFWGTVGPMQVFDDGSGPGLIVSGNFATAGGLAVNHIARWDGAGWSSLGGGLPVGAGCLHVFDDGNGERLYAGGTFSSAGGVPAGGIARWDGASWSDVGGGVSAPGGAFVAAMTTFDDGCGPALYVGGSFSSAGGVPVSNLARWNGTTWSALAGGPGPGGTVGDLDVFDDGSGPALYATGSFMMAGGLTVEGLARWDGSTWSQVGPLSGITSISGNVLEVFDDGSGPGLYVGGQFLSIGGITAASIARWSCGSSLSLSMTQPGGAGSPVFLSNANLTPGSEYYNVFSFDLCAAGPGAGPFAGLCFTSPANLLFLHQQLQQPLNSSFPHFQPPASHVTWPSLPLPPLTVDALTFEWSGGSPGAISPVTRLVIQ